MADISYWEEYDIIHNNRNKPINVINSKLDDLYRDTNGKPKHNKEMFEKNSF
jgi:hypothetical protein